MSQLVNAEVNSGNCNSTRGQHAGMNCCSMHLYSDKATISTNQHVPYIKTLLYRKYTYKILHHVLRKCEIKYCCC